MLMKKMLRTVWNYKSQFISMIIMAAIGIGVFLGFNIHWHSLRTNAFDFFEDTHYADYRLYSNDGFTKKDIDAISRIIQVEAATGYLSINIDVKDFNNSLTLNISDNYTVSTMFVTSGTEYDESIEGVWLSDKYADANGIEIGDNISLLYMGKVINLCVVGLCKSGENMICVADENQLMPDFESHGFAYISPKTFENMVGSILYPQVNIVSSLEKSELIKALDNAIQKTVLVTSKDEHVSYAGVKSEIEEGKTMGSILPALFLSIAILTMVTTMHRITVKEKVQIGTLKALGFRNSKIMMHYASYGFLIGVIGIILGIVIGFLVAYSISSPDGTMSTYVDMPEWTLHLPVFCVPVIVATLALLTLIGLLSVKRILKGSASDALRPYTPKAMKKSLIETLPWWESMSFGAKWNVRDVLRHKARSAMTLVGVFGCMLLIIGGLGMRDTMTLFIEMLDRDINNYETKVILPESISNNEAVQIAEQLDGDWQAVSGISYDDRTISLEIYNADNGKIRFLDENNELMELSDEGVYLCLRLKDTAKIGDTIEFSPYGEDIIYRAKVAGYFRSLVSECIIMSDTCAKLTGVEYNIDTIYTDISKSQISSYYKNATAQDKNSIIETYDLFMEIMDVMIIILVIAAIVLGIVVLYNLGAMSYVERYRELATLKVLGFRDNAIGNLLITQNIWLTFIGSLIGLPGGVGILYVLLKALADEYELSLYIGLHTYIFCAALIFGVSLFVGIIIVRKNKGIDMVEALKGTE